jgi:DNA ligase-1
MRFPRISRLRWDKQPRDADRIETLERLLQSERALDSSTGVDATATEKGYAP